MLLTGGAARPDRSCVCYRSFVGSIVHLRSHSANHFVIVHLYIRKKFEGYRRKSKSAVRNVDLFIFPDKNLYAVYCVDDQTCGRAEAEPRGGSNKRISNYPAHKVLKCFDGPTIHIPVIDSCHWGYCCLYATVFTRIPTHVVYASTGTDRSSNG